MLAAWCSTLFAFPGNWILVGLGALFAGFFPAASGRGVHWATVGVAAGLALLGEVVELGAGAAGARKAGANRRSIVLALVGTLVGSMGGALCGTPIPLFGPVVGALAGGAAGAFAGAFIGETAIGRDPAHSLAVGKAALTGRLLGTVGKLLAGAVILVLISIDAIF